MINDSIKLFLMQSWSPLLRDSPKYPNFIWPICDCKNPSARKSLHQFSEVLDVKQKTDVRRLGNSK